MKKNTFIFFLFLCSISFGQEVFINEIHYDNASGDTNEAIEIAGQAGTDLSTYSLVLYNGSNSSTYNTTNLSGTITDLQNGFGVVNFPITGIQNGPSDGIALVNNETGTDVVIQFLSYEGTIIAVNGPAMGMTSTDIGVNETNSTPVGQSLQLSGTGSVYTDFTWNAPATATAGSINTGQTFPILSIGDNAIIEFSMYPNPSNNGTINIVTKENDIADVSIYNILGNIVFSTKLDHSELRVNNLSTGVYIVNVIQGQTSMTKKLIVR